MCQMDVMLVDDETSKCVQLCQKTYQWISYSNDNNVLHFNQFPWIERQLSTILFFIGRGCIRHAEKHCRESTCSSTLHTSHWKRCGLKKTSPMENKHCLVPEKRRNIKLLCVNAEEEYWFHLVHLSVIPPNIQKAYDKENILARYESSNTAPGTQTSLDLCQRKVQPERIFVT